MLEMFFRIIHKHTLKMHLIMILEVFLHFPIFEIFYLLSIKKIKNTS